MGYLLKAGIRGMTINVVSTGLINVGLPGSQAFNIWARGKGAITNAGKVWKIPNFAVRQGDFLHHQSDVPGDHHVGFLLQLPQERSDSDDPGALQECRGCGSLQD